MKRPKLGDYLTWNGRLAKIVGGYDQPSVRIEFVDDATCPHCGESLGKEQFMMIPTSPLFQESAEPIQTMSE